MAITDLTGKTLTFNVRLNLINLGEYDIYFNLTNGEDLDPTDGQTGLVVSSESLGYTFFDYGKGPDGAYRTENVYYPQVGWTNLDYMTITITGGDDATNTDLIAWLLENSDLQPDPEPTANISSFNTMSVTDNEGFITINIGDTSFDFKKHEGEVPITDLTGTKWLFNDTINLTITGAYDIDFSDLNDGSWHSIDISAPYSMDYILDISEGALLTAYDTTNGWADSAYRTITITGGTDVTNADLIAWLQANATQIPANQVNLISFTINGTTYQAEEGMTWAEWRSSEYNTLEQDGTITKGTGGIGSSMPVSSSEEIENGGVYSFIVPTSGGSSN